MKLNISPNYELMETSTLLSMPRNEAIAEEIRRRGGYDRDVNKSNRGLLAESEGRYPASRVAKMLGIKAAFIVEKFEPEEYHHIGSQRRENSVREVNYYCYRSIKSTMDNNPNLYTDWLKEYDSRTWRRVASVSWTEFEKERVGHGRFRKTAHLPHEVTLQKVKIMEDGQWLKIMEKDGAIRKKKRSNVRIVVSEALERRKKEAAARQWNQQLLGLRRVAKKDFKTYGGVAGKLLTPTCLEKLEGLGPVRSKAWAAIKNGQIHDFILMGGCPEGQSFEEFRAASRALLGENRCKVASIHISSRRYEEQPYWIFESKEGARLRTKKELKELVAN